MKYGFVMNMSAISMLGLGLLGMPVFAAENQISSTSSTTMGNPNSMSSSTSEQNKVASAAFLAKNKTRSGVITLPDGLQYKIVTDAEGVQPTASDTVMVNYEGKLIDGRVFDSSYERGQPVSFPVNAVIAGWVEALQLMKVGSVWELYIPSSLAYGEAGAPPLIGPNQALIFKVELLGLKKD